VAFWVLSLVFKTVLGIYLESLVRLKTEKQEMPGISKMLISKIILIPISWMRTYSSIKTAVKLSNEVKKVKSKFA
jgi:hypothetical protein